ncbi:Hypothetical protein PHPALM_8955 [Phytophthora palmivora]|uniref:Uncharacterized protein n=1 Tax=Phytophthora palmivora TaxID=4796 RepID=A0A2P4Y8J5_9STRA|nr:Hypothetical protein PHPALM_8955 [Phytophthora palmivora]
MSANQELDYPTVAHLPTVAHPIFAVTAAPKVEDISHEALTQWFDLRLEYEEIMRARCESSEEDLKSVMRSCKDELTDEFIWDWIMTTVRNFKNNALPNIDELFQDRLVMSMTKSDVDARVLDYFHLCNTIVKNNGLAALFSEEDGAKKKCKILLNCLPEELKTRV